MDTDIGRYVKDNWSELLQFLPPGWEESAKKLKAFIRPRGFKTVESLLRTLMIHLTLGYSLRTTSTVAKKTGLANVTDVAILTRLKQAGDWFGWMARQLRSLWLSGSYDGGDETIDIGKIRAIDGTTIQEPGAKGITWRVHYSLSLSTLHCDEAHVSSPETGESFKNFKVNPDDILIADRAYATPSGISYVLGNQGHVIVRYLSSLPVYDKDLNKVDLLGSLKDLEIGQIEEMNVNLLHGKEPVPCRLCAVRKTELETAKAQKKVRRVASKNGYQTKQETLEFAGYVIVLTTLPEEYSCAGILDAYRRRWQIELAFKRLKSLLSIGNLKKYNEDSAKAWIQGKLFVAMLVETMLRAGEAFFPWGYPIVAEVP